MTDWDLITEYIQNAMQAVDKAHDAANGLRENASRETLDQFRAQMAELTEHLTKLQTVLEHQDTYVLEELADRLSTLLGGKRPEYRRTPRMEETAL
ncbi:MAG: hypothetical protein ACOYYF_00860 [Chloroflexota bacterium]|nr:hypothetical protein [Chloroflexota bacterium]MBI5703453.1 hypothetical protein [Chloroflexota bacterium]